MARVQNPNTMLTEHIHEECKGHIDLDTYDPDFILGVIQNWLKDHNAVLTERGVERV